MSENLPNMDELFREAIDAHEEMPSGNVWANIDKQLDKKKVVSISKKYKKLKWAVAAMLIFSAGMAMYTWNTRVRNKELVRQTELQKKKAIKMRDTGAVANKATGQNAAGHWADTATANIKAGVPVIQNGEKSWEA